jgi:hypothetical protein
MLFLRQRRSKKVWQNQRRQTAISLFKMRQNLYMVTAFTQSQTRGCLVQMVDKRRTEFTANKPNKQAWAEEVKAYKKQLAGTG